MADFAFTLVRFPNNPSTPLSASSYVYCSDVAFSTDRMRPGFAAGQFGTYEFAYSVVPVNGALAIQNNFQTIKWQLVWTSATVWTMNVWDGSAWVPAPGFGSLNPTVGWLFQPGHYIRNICTSVFQNAGLAALKNNYPTTYKLHEVVTKNGAPYEDNTSTHLFDVRLLATANEVQTVGRINPVDFSQLLTYTGNWVALPAPNSPYPSTIPGQASWQPTSANISSVVEYRAGAYSGPVVYNAATNVPVTAPTTDGVVGTFSLSWNGLNAGLPVLGDFVTQILGDTGAGNTVPGGASSNNFAWPYLGKAQCTRCPEKSGSSTDYMSITPVGNPYGIDMSASMSYDSMYSGQQPASFGFGWKSIQSCRVSIDGSGNLLYQDESGGFLRWNFTAPNTFAPFTKDNYVKASLNSVTHKYTLTFKDSTQRVFNDTTVANPGKLIQTIDRNGNSLTYTYNGAGHLIQVTDSTPAARSLFYSYGTRTDGQPISIRAINATTGNQWQFLYYAPTDPIAPNRLGQIVDPVGDTTTYNYLATGQIASIVDSTGKVARQFGYDEIGRKVAEQSYQDLYTTYDYGRDAFTNTFGNCTTTTIEDLTRATPTRILVTYYDTNFNEVLIKELVDQAATPIVLNETSITYNDTVSLNPYLPTQILAPNLTTTNMTYNVNGNLASETDAQSHVTLYTYAEDGPTPDPNPKHHNLLIKLTRPTVTVNGVLTNYTPENWAYDANGNLQTYTDSLSHTIGFTYNTDGTVATITDENGHIRTLGYNATRNLTTVTLPKHPYDPGGPSQRITTLAYDAYDNRTSVIDALGHSTSWLYDANDRVTKVTDALGKFTTLTYTQGLLTESEAPTNQGSGANRRRTAYGYDGSNRLELVNREVFSGGFQTRVLYGYTGTGQLSSLQCLQANGRLNNTTASFDMLGRQVLSMDPLGRVTRTKYAPYCGSYEVDSPRGVRSVYALDTLCRLTQIATQTEIRSFNYDELSRKISDANGGRYGWNVDPVTMAGAKEGDAVYQNGRTYLYDALDRLTNLTFMDTTGSNPGLVYVYDNVGNVLQKTDSNGTVTTFTYYDDNRLATVTLGGATFTYVYDLAGRLLTITYPASSGLVATFGWDNKDRLTSLQYKIGVTNFQSFVYTYDDSDNRITLIDTTGAGPAINWTFAYDWLNRLLSASRNGVPTSYSYDASDNRVTTTSGATVDTDTCNAGDQLTRRTRGADFEDFLYDRDGNLAIRTLSTGNVTTYKWNDFNQLLSIALNGVGQESDFYDSDGIRRLRSDGTKFYNSGALITSEVRPSGAVSFIQGHQLLGLKQGANLFFLISDGLGSVRQVVTSAGVSSATFESDAYGVQTTATGPADLLSNTYTGAFGVRNEVTGGRQLYYARARWYDSSLGRWLSADPVAFAGGLNPYNYVEANPTNAVDPSGLDAYLDLVVVEGGTYNYYGHAFIEIKPIPGTNSSFSKAEEYATYPKGLQKDWDVTAAYARNTKQHRLRTKLNSSQEKALKDYLDSFKRKSPEEQWSPYKNCGFWAINLWDKFAPKNLQISLADATERVDTSKLNDPRLKLLPYRPQAVTPKKLGSIIDSLQAKQNAGAAPSSSSNPSGIKRGLNAAGVIWRHVRKGGP